MRDNEIRPIGDLFGASGAAVASGPRMKIDRLTAVLAALAIVSLCVAQRV
jgi:hypothetical protein